MRAARVTLSPVPRAACRRRLSDGSFATLSRRRQAARAGCVLLTLLLGTPAPAGDDWPAFRGGPQLTGVSGSDLPSDLKLLWKRDAPDGVTATGAVVGDRVFVAELSGALHCLDRDSGKEVWTYWSVEEAPQNSFRPGYKSSPTVTDSLVLLGDEDGVLHAVNRADGTRAWTAETDGEIISSPTIADVGGTPVVLVGSYDNTLRCYTLADGTERWKVETEGYVHCTPAVVGGRTFIAGCDEHLRGVDIATGEVTLNLPIGTYLIASPAVRGGRLYFGTYGANILCIDPAGPGKVVWTAGAGGDFPYRSSCAVTDDLVIASGRDKHVRAFDRATGEERWAFKMKAGSDSSPVISGGRVYVGGNDRELHCLDLKTGEQVWSQNLRKDVTASPAIGEGVLVIGTEGPNGTVYCFGS